MPRSIAILVLTLLGNISVFADSSTNSVPTLAEALASKQDLWGLAAMRRPNGPSYEFFEKLLPPLRYVNAAFRYYPIILSAPDSSHKVRLQSNGGALNPHAELKTWKEKGVPVNFFVGENQTPFGADLHHVDGPHYEEGWLPIVQIQYTNGGTTYTEETFAGADSRLTPYGVAFMRFEAKGQPGKIIAAIKSAKPVTATDRTLVAADGQVLVWFDRSWKWDAASQRLTAAISRGHRATLAVASVPFKPDRPFAMSRDVYEKQKNMCASTWKTFIHRGMRLDTPEPVVNNAWRSLIVGNQIMVEGDSANYSWGNAYERLYEAECGDDVRAFLLYGFLTETRRMIPPLLDYTNDKLQFHNAGFKLQLLAHYYWLTRDAEFVRSTKAHWQKYAALITDGREADSGLAPREGYCGDIFTQVYSLNSNAAGWRGLRDIAAVLADMGETAEAERLAGIARDYRQKILAAVDKSEFRDAKPAFIPIALFGEEKPYDTLTGTMVAGYWNLLAPYVLQSGIFGPGSERERTMLDYSQEHGGICMGMIRFDQHSGLFANENAVDDLYGLRYANKLLQIDEPDRALVCFYGKLAQGMTRDTFIGAEGTGLKPLDEFGRAMYLPPNSAANAHFLWTLRYLLVQDWDADGKPDTLRLLFATPRSWLEDSKVIRIERAPTAFGEVSIMVKSRLKHGEVVAEIQPPIRNPPAQSFIRIRLPDGWKIISAKIARNSEHLSETSLAVDERGTIKLPHSVEKFTVGLQVAKVPN
jgi:hypothetical protein